MAAECRRSRRRRTTKAAPPPDRNGNGLGASGCSTIQAIFHPTTTLPGGTVQTRTSLFGHNAYGQLVFEQDPGGVRTTYEYQPESDVDGSGAFPIAGGDPATGGFRKSLTRDTVASIYGAPVPITTKVSHNRIGDIVRTVNGRGIATTLITNEVHLVREVIEASDTSEQPGQRNEVEAVPALSIRTIFTRDANDNVVKVEVDNRDNDSSHTGAFIETRTVLDILDRPLEVERDVTEGDVVTTTLRYDANQNLISTDGTQVPHVHARTTYDERDLVFESFRGTGAEEARYETEVDRNGNVTAVISPVDRVKEAGGSANGELDRVTTTYDGHDRSRLVSDALGNMRVVAFDPASQVIAHELYGHPAGSATAAPILLAAGSTTHDEAGRVARTKALLFVDSATQAALARTAELDTDDAGDTTSVTVTALHDVNDRRTEVRVPNRVRGDEVTTLVYDGHGHVEMQTDAEGNGVELHHDNAHQVVRMVETDVQPEGEIAAQTFESALLRDALGRVIRSTDPKGATRRFTWGTLHRPTALDALENVTRTRLDGLGRVIRAVRELTTTGIGGAPLDTSNPNNPDGLITTLSHFDDAVNETRLVDDLGNTTRYAHDSRGNVETTTYADETVSRTEYDLADGAIGVTDQAGNVFTNTIDALGRLVQTDIARASGFVGTTQIVREFDGLSRLTRATDNGGDGALAFESELVNRYDSLGNVLEELTSGRVVSRTFKSAADPVSLTYPDGTRIAYETDRLSRLTTLEEDGDEQARWRYIGQRTHRRAWGNGTTTRYSYDSNRRLHRVRHDRGAETLFDFEAGYNAEDCLTHEIRHHDGGTGLQVRLDSAYRILAYRDGVADPAGPPGAGTIREESWTLDGLGNWNVYSESLDGGTPAAVTTAINEMNEYTQFGADPQTHDDNGDRTLDDRHTYQWDALGRLRVVKDNASGDVIARYCYHADGRRTRKETGPGNAGELRFVWDGTRMVEETRPNGLVRGRTVWGRGWELVTYQKVGLKLFYHRDAKGWIAGVTKKNGKVDERYSYSAYGRVDIAAHGPWIWHGYHRDPESAAYYVISRYFDPKSGRWITRDQAGFSDGPNAFAAFAQNPIQFSDPLGTEIRVGDTETLNGRPQMPVYFHGGWGSSPELKGWLDPVAGTFQYLDSAYIHPVSEVARQIAEHGAYDERTSTWAIDAAITTAATTVVTAELSAALLVAPECPGLGVGLAVDAARRWNYYNTGHDPIADQVRAATGAEGGSVEVLTTGAVVGGSVIAYAHLAVLTADIAAEIAAIRRWWDARHSAGVEYRLDGVLAEDLRLRDALLSGLDRNREEFAGLVRWRDSVEADWGRYIEAQGGYEAFEVEWAASISRMEQLNASWQRMHDQLQALNTTLGGR